MPGFYDLKETPVPVGQYTKVPTNTQYESTSAFCDWVRNYKLRICCSSICCAVISSIILLLIPGTPVFNSAAQKVQRIISAEGISVTGVDVAINHIGLALTEADLFGMQVANPSGFSATPYFMKCDFIRCDVDWMTLFQSSFHTIVLNELFMKGLTVYIDQQVGAAANGKIILDHISTVMATAGNSSGNWAETVVLDKKRKYSIKTVNVEAMHVLIYMDKVQVRAINVPPMVVRDIGVQQNGVSFEELFHLLVQSLSVVAMNGEESGVQAKIDQTMNNAN